MTPCMAPAPLGALARSAQRRLVPEWRSHGPPLSRHPQAAGAGRHRGGPPVRFRPCSPWPAAWQRTAPRHPASQPRPPVLAKPVALKRAWCTVSLTSSPLGSRMGCRYGRSKRTLQEVAESSAQRQGSQRAGWTRRHGAADGSSKQFGQLPSHLLVWPVLPLPSPGPEPLVAAWRATLALGGCRLPVCPCVLVIAVPFVAWCILSFFVRLHVLPGLAGELGSDCWQLRVVLHGDQRALVTAGNAIVVKPPVDAD